MSDQDDSVFLPNEEDDANPEKEMENQFETAFYEYRAKIVPFTKDETGKMIEWIVKNNAFNLLMGDTIWKRMEFSGLLEERNWKSMKIHFHQNVLTLLDEIKVSRNVKWKLEACMKNPDALEFLCDADLDSEPEPCPRKNLVDIVKRTKKRKELDGLDSSDGDQIKGHISAGKKIVRKRSKVPADKFDESIQLSSFSSRSSIESPKENGVDTGVEPRLEALLDNSNIEQLSIMRDSSGASKSIDISSTTINVPDISHVNESHKKLVNGMEVGSLVDDVPAAVEFSAGLKEAGARDVSQMSQERELSLIGVTSTLRNDGGDDFSPSRCDDKMSNCSRSVYEDKVQPIGALTPDGGSNIENPVKISVSPSSINISRHLSGGDEGSNESFGEDSNSTKYDAAEGIPGDVRKMQQLEVQLGIDKVDTVYLMIKGLPEDIDLENVEFVRAGLNKLDGNSNESNSETEKRKMKIICLEDSVKDVNKSKEWKKKGPYEVKFRTPYSKKEDLSIITFLKDWKSKKGILSLGGNRVWKIMEKRMVCKGRSWESMKERWRGYLADNLGNYNINNI